MTIEPNITLEDLSYSIENNFLGGDCIRLFEFPQLLDILLGIIFQKKTGYLLQIVSVNALKQFKNFSLNRYDISNSNFTPS